MEILLSPFLFRYRKPKPAKPALFALQRANEQGYASAQVALKKIQDQSTGFPFKNIKEALSKVEIGELIKSQTSLLWIIPFVFLIMSFSAGILGYWPEHAHGWYNGETSHIPRWLVELIKFSVSFMSGFLFYAHTKVSKILTKVAATFLIISVIYNPIIPIHFSPQLWCYFDLIVAAIIGIHFYYAKRQLL